MHCPKIMEGFHYLKDHLTLPSLRNQQTLDKIAKVAKEAFFCVLGAAFFVTNPVIFSISLFAGIVFDDQTQDVLNRIKAIWKRQPWPVLALLSVGALLSLQVTWATTAVLFASKLGSYLSLSSKLPDDSETSN